MVRVSNKKYKFGIVKVGSNVEPECVTVQKNRKFIMFFVSVFDKICIQIFFLFYFVIGKNC